MKIKTLKTNKGVTLIELIVSLMILSIALLIAYSLFFFGNRTFSKGVDQFNVQSNIRLASDYITSQIRYATDIQILGSMDSNKISDPFNAIDAYENYIFYDGERIVRLSKYSSNSFLIGTGGEVTFSSTSPGEILNFTVSGVDSQQNYHIDSEVKPLNLSLNGGSINTGTGYVIYYRTADDYLAKEALPEATMGDPNNPNGVDVNYSKGILEATILSENETSPASSIAKTGTHDLRISIESPGASNGRRITFSVKLDDNNVYEYTVTYTTHWTIE
jgi:prepilin-type N-terminal cleavage/methylation domain-containing protein